jgi:hypothetical protein
VILLPLPPEFWDYRYILPNLAKTTKCEILLNITMEMVSKQLNTKVYIF